MKRLNKYQLDQKLSQWQAEYASNKPFPHIIIDAFLEEKIAKEALGAFPRVHKQGWIHYVHYNENKHGLNKAQLLAEEFKLLIEELNSKTFLSFLENLTGIKNLLADSELEGGGLHQTLSQGFLNVHADFTVHPHKKMWRRRVNVLIYLNEDWQEKDGGYLELWPKDMRVCVQKILPIFNRCVIFNTDEHSYHGVSKVSCEAGNTRKSIALYYFTEEKKKPHLIATNYRARPGDNAFWIWLDKKAVAIYTKLKSWFGLNDDIVSRFLDRFRDKN